MVDHTFNYPNGQGAPLPSTIGGFRVLERADGEKGSQASIYKALDTVTGQEVAIKVLGSQYESYELSLLAALVGEKDIEELRREAQILYSLDHPNIVSVIQIGEDSGLGPYAVMEWMPYGDLGAYKRMSLGHSLSVAEVLSIAQDILSGLAAAHEAGVIHLDVKPGNILIGPNGSAKLADFGIAGGVTGSEALPGRGTLGYMAPEQEDPQRTHEIGPHTDIYALGIVLFEILVGRRPCNGEEAQQLLAGFPEEVANAIIRAINIDPCQRFSSADEMAISLLRAK